MKLFPPWVLWDGPPVSTQLDTGNVCFVLIFPSCSASLLGHWGKPTPLSLDTAQLSKNPRPDGPEERKLPPAGNRAQSEGKASCARRSEGDLAPPVGRRRRAGSPTLTQPRGLTQKQFCRSAQTGSPNPNGAEQLHDPPQNTVRNNHSLYGMRPWKGSHLRHF